MSLSVNVDGPALLGEVTALPLVVVSTGDGLDDATLVLTVKEGDKAYLGSTRENGGIRSEEASAPARMWCCSAHRTPNRRCNRASQSR